MYSETINPDRKISDEDIEFFIALRDLILIELEKVDRGQTIVLDDFWKN